MAGGAVHWDENCADDREFGEAKARAGAMGRN